LSSDVIIIGGLIVAAVLCVGACVQSRLAFGKLGFLVSGAVFCVGWASFGWKPFIGEGRSTESYFGCLASCLGVVAFCLFGVIEEVWRRPQGPSDERRGFPVIPSAKEKSDPRLVE
jgi:hypothetical protein